MHNQVNYNNIVPLGDAMVIQANIQISLQCVRVRQFEGKS